MKKILLYILGALVVIVLGILGVAATKADAFHIQRSATINAPAEKIFAHINDFHNWTAWSPWEKLDPAMKRSYSGAASGKGAMYAWNGNSDVGSGNMEITESTPSSRIVIALNFLTPFEGHNIAEFTLEPAGESTKVTWAMHGPMNFVAKVMSVFFSMDSMVGNQFAQGLTTLGALTSK
jgi:uncharacterized protein YndB with AHSA1/START domain